jgi:hypothetical protein
MPNKEKQEIGIPAAYLELFNSDVDWDDDTEPQSELNDRERYWPRGKMLGGASATNAMGENQALALEPPVALVAVSRADAASSSSR